MRKTLEKTYSYAFKKVLKTVNPIKKRIMKTECIVHRFINAQSLVVLKNDGYTEAHKFMKEHIIDLNDGVIWADQDLKSSNHFYNPHSKKGLYGNSNAKVECISYYDKALDEYSKGNMKDAMFYLGAACHLIQDLTVPHHANVKLFKGHKTYENWVIRSHRHYDEFRLCKGGIYFSSLEDYIDHNSKEAIDVYRKNSHIKNKQTRFHMITERILTMAEATTAGVMLMFFKDMKLKPV